MDECTEWELNNVVACIPYTDRNMWETSRLNAFITAKAWFKGIKKFFCIGQFKSRSSRTYNFLIKNIGGIFEFAARQCE